MIVFQTQDECEQALKLINKNMGLPTKETETWDIPHPLKDGQFGIDKPDEKFLVGLVYSETETVFSDLKDIEIAPTLRVDTSKIDLVIDSKYHVISRTDNYLDKTVAILYVQGKEKKSLIVKVENLSPDKGGYSIDIEQLIRDNEKQ